MGGEMESYIVPSLLTQSTLSAEMLYEEFCDPSKTQQIWIQ